MRELDLLVGFEDFGGEDFGFEAGDGDYCFRLVEGEPFCGGGVAGPELLVDVEGVAAAGVVGVLVPTEVAAFGFIDGFAVGLEPLADRLETLDGFFGDGAVGFGADVEQVIAAAAGAGGEVGDDGLGGLPGVVETVETP